MNKVAISILFILMACNDESPQLVIKSGNGVSDIDGNFYPSVIIGEQEWLTMNLRSTKFNDGANIEQVTDVSDFLVSRSPAYTWYDNDLTYKETYGALYNWLTVKTAKCCPAGWHVPSNTEWAKLIETLGGELVAGGKLKEAGFTHWDNPNLGATNISSFTALPGGGLFSQLFSFENIGKHGSWWSSTESSTGLAYSLQMYFDNENVELHSYYFTNMGLSVRCIKD